MLGALCYLCVPNIDELTIRKFQLELGEFAPGLEPLEFVSVECSPNLSCCKNTSSLAIVISIANYDTYENNSGIGYELTTYSVESCLDGFDKHYSFIFETELKDV